ncbi:MAG TPA: FHA domain-containing protein [Anaerolineales bacterium]|nr:FHA domain-containing protein [Anaerolineales bacterium]
MGGEVLLLLRLALVILLYAFLGYTLLTIWRDIQRQAEVLASRQAQSITLLRITTTGVEPYYFTASEITVGRDPTCDCHLDDKTVSASHARLSYHHNQWWIEDLDSRNGTYLNSELISTPTVITSSDELHLGEVICKVEIGERHERTFGEIKEISSV